MEMIVGSRDHRAERIKLINCETYIYNEKERHGNGYSHIQSLQGEEVSHGIGDGARKAPFVQ